MPNGKKEYMLPSTSADSIKIPVRHDILPETCENTFVSMVKFRNKVVHLYQKIDNKEVYKTVINHLQDINQFIKSIAEQL